VSLYDVFYYPDTLALTRCYRFICMTEVIEHLASPAEVLSGLWQQLKAGGWLVVQTQRVRDREAFARWRYLDDPTHIAFYSEATFAWLAEYLGAVTWEVADRDVVVLKKCGFG
jgi:2-polyprenyl-3-methyl-5-hydroxy-6-metoxy-1,4-benzoquinol methylase